MADISDQIADFHVRLGRLEDAVHTKKGSKQDSLFEDIVELFSAGVALVCCFYGLGIPNHLYQGVFAILIVSALYHREIFPRPKQWHDWALAILNVMILTMILKIIIGGGEPKPFSWLYLPSLEGGLPMPNISWQQIALSDWALKLTEIQTFFLVLTLFGALIQFELFSGLTAFVLVLLSLPALVDFNWAWTLPALVSALFCFYLQVERE